MSVVETKTCPDSGISIRLFRFFGLDGIYGKSSMYTTFIQWWDDNGVNSQVRTTESILFLVEERLLFIFSRLFERELTFFQYLLMN